MATQVPGELCEARLKGAPSDELRALNDSLGDDIRLYREDIAGSRAHVRMLTQVGILSEDERDVIVSGLDQVEEEFATGRFETVPSDEDIHTAVERRLTEIVGPVGGKVHTARSRNDQVALDLRLWIRSEVLTNSVPAILSLQKTLVQRSEEHVDDYLPGYTHLQQAQPVSLGHHLLAHFWALARDVDRLMATVERLNISPLGAGALAGTSLEIDPELSAAHLGFSGAFQNSLDAVSDRDPVAEILFDLALLAVHLSRIGEELTIWATTEFNYVLLDDRFSTGSSMLPQKKNPDVAELARGKSGRIVGHLTGLLTTLKGLPLAYNKDLQEDKAHLFDSFDTVAATLTALNGLLATVTFNVDLMAERAGSPYLATTDLADFLVERGMPFREAHALLGELVHRSLSDGLDFVEVVEAHEELGSDALFVFAKGASAGSRTSRGGGSPEAVSEQLGWARDRLVTDEGRLADMVAKTTIES